LLFPGNARNDGRFSANQNFRGNFERSNFRGHQRFHVSGFRGQRKFTYSIDVASTKKFKSSSACPTVSLLTQKQNRERLCCIFPGSMLKFNSGIKRIFAQETATPKV
jgi:hypothetical protein